MKIEDSVLSIAGNYETIFVDIYGVLFDGIRLYDQALATLSKLKEYGKRIVILSNSTQVLGEAMAGYSRRGMLPDVHYDKFVTSGEFLRQVIKNRPDKFAELVGQEIKSMGNLFFERDGIFSETNLINATIAEADCVYVGVPQVSYGRVRMDDVWDSRGHRVNMEDVLDKDWDDLQDSQGRRGFSEFATRLKSCRDLGKTLLLANPDIFAHMSLPDCHGRVAVVTQGAIGAYYEKMGGKVVRFGKPYPGIFEYAKELINPRGPVLMVGDTPWTDICGANALGLDSALVTMTGIVDEFLRKMDSGLSMDEKLKILFDQIAAKMTKKSGPFSPTYLLKQFSHIG